MTIATSWAAFEEWIRASAPPLALRLGPRVTPEEIAKFEKKMRRTFPGALRELLSLRNGAKGIMGGSDLMSAEEIAKDWEMQLGVAHARRKEADVDYPAKWQNGLLPFVIDGTGEYLAIDEAGMVHQCLKAVDPLPLAPFTAWLDRIVLGLREGDIQWRARPHSDDGEFVPPRGAMGFELFNFPEKRGYVRFHGGRTSAEIGGPFVVRFDIVDGAQAVDRKLAFEVVVGGAVVDRWTFADRAQPPRINPFTGAKVDPADCVVLKRELFTLAGPAVLRVVGLDPNDTIWVHFAKNPPLPKQPPVKRPAK